MKLSRPLLATSILLFSTVLLAGCVTPPTPEPSSSVSVPSTTTTPSSSETPVPGQTGEFFYDEKKVEASYEEAVEAGVEEVVAVPPVAELSVPGEGAINFGDSASGVPVPLVGGITPETDDWLVEVKGWELTDVLPGAPDASAGEQYFVAYLDVAYLGEGAGRLGDVVYLVVSFKDGGFVTLTDSPEEYEGDYLTVEWDGSGVKEGVTAAAVVPDGVEVESFAFSLYGNGTVLHVATS